MWRDFCYLVPFKCQLKFGADGIDRVRELLPNSTFCCTISFGSIQKLSKYFLELK